MTEVCCEIGCELDETERLTCDQSCPCAMCQYYGSEFCKYYMQEEEMLVEVANE